MPRQNVAIMAFNSGALSIEALSRVDLERVPFSLEEMTNWLPRVIGSKTIRPGTKYLGSVKNDDTGINIPFVKDATDTALLELTDNLLRVRVNDLLVTRGSVSTAVSNGDFSSLTNWTDADDGGATSDLSSGQLRLLGTGNASARRVQQVTVGGGDTGDVHALRIVVTRGPVMFKVGSTTQGQEYIKETELRTGVHSLTLTPSGDFYITVSSSAPVYRFVDSITVEASGVMELPTPWDETILNLVRYDQSGDVIFCACDDIRQMRIERRSATSWSICDYKVDDGPFRGLNLSRQSIAPSGVSGNITLTANTALFDAGHVGALFKLTHSGQTATATLGGDDEYTSEIRITGTTEIGTRNFVVSITGTWTGTLTLQRAFGEPGTWSDVTTYTANADDAREDDADNEIVFYRVGFKTGDYGTGSAVVSLIYANSSQTGIVRITAVTNKTTADAEVLSTLGKAAATFDWREGSWSTYRGFPRAVAFDDGRLVWLHGTLAYHSVSDAFESFDQELEGDAAPIIRTVSQEEGLWIKSVGRLFIGSAGRENQVRSSSFDEPLTQTAYSIKRVSSRGSGFVDPVDVDTVVVFSQRDDLRVYEISYDVESQDYSSKPLTRLNPEACSPGIVRIAVQRQPDTRVYFVLEDGTCAILTYERYERVVAWSKFETAGLVKDICILPGVDEDQVYFIVERTVSDVPKRYVERLAKESECVGASVSWLMDCATHYTGSSVTTITGLGHLEGRGVIVWAGGAAAADQSSLKTVTSGSITLTSAVSSATIGLPFTARSKSMKLAFAAGLGTALNQLKRVDHLGVLLRNTAWKGIRFGRSWAKLNYLPKMRHSTGQAIADNTVFDYYDEETSPFDGKFGPDERLYCEAKAPYPATVLGYVIGMVTNDKG